jgi:hypothetical protein
VKNFVTLTVISALLATTACGGGKHPSTLSENAIYGPDSKPQATRDVAYDTQIKFDEDAHMLPRRPLTRTEAIMIHQIQLGGLEFAKTHIRGAAGQLVKKTTVAAILQGLGTIAGAAVANIPGLNILSYGKLAAGSGAGGGAFAGYMTIEQARGYANFAWQAAQIAGLKSTGDRRLIEVVAIPILGMSGEPMPVDWNKITPTPRQRCTNKVGASPELMRECLEKTPKVEDDNDRSLPLPM